MRPLALALALPLLVALAAPLAAQTPEETARAALEAAPGYPALFAELARRGYSQAELEKISSRNMMRVLREAEAYATAHRGDPPIEHLVAD